MSSVHSEFARTMQEMVDAWAEGDVEKLEDMFKAWDNYVACLGKLLDRICRRVCKRREMPICGCMSEDEYWSLVSYISDKCNGSLKRG